MTGSGCSLWAPLSSRVNFTWWTAGNRDLQPLLGTALGPWWENCCEEPLLPPETYDAEGSFEPRCFQGCEAWLFWPRWPQLCRLSSLVRASLAESGVGVWSVQRALCACGLLTGLCQLLPFNSCSEWRVERKWNERRKLERRKFSPPRPSCSVTDLETENLLEVFLLLIVKK